MKMAGVMYQGYASYLQAYQRHSSSYCSTAPTFTFNPYDKKYRFPEICNAPSPSLAEQSAPQIYNPPPPEAVSTVPTSTTDSSASVPVVGSAVAPSTGSSSTRSVTNCVSSPAVPQPASVETTKSETKGTDDYADAHYLSANCVVLTYFSGDLAAAVDEHFTRALSQAYSKGAKDPCPMSERNLPASFWNSHYYHTGYPSTGGAFAHEAFYSDFHGLPQPDPWAYNLTAAQQYSHHHRAVSDFTYMPSTSRYSHNYSSLLMGRPRLPQCVVGKADPWTPSTARFHEELGFDPSSYSHHFTPMTGLESSGTSHQDHGSKDLYWI